MFQQLKEALDNWMMGSGATTGRQKALVLKAARSYLALLQVCDQCGGSGTVVDRSDTEVDGETVVACAFGPCPSCSGRGHVVSDQAVERGAKAAHRSRWRRAYLPTWDSELDSVKDEYRHAARAVLAAAIFGEETE